MGQREDFEQVKRNAEATGADDVVVRDLKRPFVTDYILPAIAANAIYENRYYLGTPLARPLIAKGQVDVAEEYGATHVAHGATGKGNDQVRFELAYAALAPHLDVIAPWKEANFFERFQGRPDLIHFAEEHGIDIPVTREKPFSTDENLMHKSYESGVLENPGRRPDADMCDVCVDPKHAPDAETLVDVEFKDGIPVRVANLNTGREETEPLAMFLYLNELGRANGIGRVDLVENRYIGIKSRGVYETPGGTILHAAQRDIEGIAMDKEVLRLRDTLSPKVAEIIYNGFWFSPEMEFLQAAMQKSQEYVDGTVELSLYKGLARPVRRASPSSLYHPDLASMDVAGGFVPSDSAGFIRINALRLKAHRIIVHKAEGEH